MNYSAGKGSLSAKSYADSGGKASSAVPTGGGGFKLSSKQSSGQTKHMRRSSINKSGTGTENKNNLPNVHTGGGSGTVAGISGRAKKMPNQQKVK